MTEDRKITVGLTGPTGAGKSTLRSVFEANGFAVLDCDIYARRVTMSGSPALAELAAEFGRDILLPDGTLSRSLLAQRAFSSEEGTRRLNALTHPHIIAMLKDDIYTAHSAGSHAVIDAPLLFEAGLENICDATIAVTAPRELRMKRIMARDGISYEQAALRVSAQHEDEYYVSRAQYHIINDGSTEDVRRAADRVIKKLTADAAASCSEGQ